MAYLGCNDNNLHGGQVVGGNLSPHVSALQEVAKMNLTDNQRRALVDLSEGGAWIRCAPQLGLNETGVLRIKGFASALPFTVRTLDGEAAHVAFTLGDAQRAELGRYIARNLEEETAAA